MNIVDKGIAIINSCKTPEQLLVAHNWVGLIHTHKHLDNIIIGQLYERITERCREIV